MPDGADDFMLHYRWLLYKYTSITCDLNVNVCGRINWWGGVVNLNEDLICCSSDIAVSVPQACSLYFIGQCCYLIGLSVDNCLKNLRLLLPPLDTSI